MPSKLCKHYAATVSTFLLLFIYWARNWIKSFFYLISATVRWGNLNRFNATTIFRYLLWNSFTEHIKICCQHITISRALNSSRNYSTGRKLLAMAHKFANWLMDIKLPELLCAFSTLPKWGFPFFPFTRIMTIKRPHKGICIAIMHF